MNEPPRYFLNVEDLYNEGTYLWAKFHNWPIWEKHFIYGSYIHHIVVVYSKYARILYNTSRYINGLEPGPVYPTAPMLEQELVY